MFGQKELTGTEKGFLGKKAVCEDGGQLGQKRGALLLVATVFPQGHGWCEQAWKPAGQNSRLKFEVLRGAKFILPLTAEAAVCDSSLN